MEVGSVLARLAVTGLQHRLESNHRVGLRDLAAQELDRERGHAAEASAYGSSSNAAQCAGLTAAKWRRSSVTRTRASIRSASATTDASVPPSGKSAYCS